MAVAEAVSAVPVQVRALASSGAGVADLPDGRVAFIHGTVPGDHAEVRVERRRKRWATARLVRLREPGPHRVDPPCSLFGTCGGCTLQHLDYPEQLRWKARFVADALGRIGRLADVAEPPIHASHARWHYRNRLTFTLRRLRGGRVVAGFHELGRPGRIVDVYDECRLGHEPLHGAWTRLRKRWGPGARLLPEGGRLRLTLHTTEQGVALWVDGGAAPWDPASLVDAVGTLAVVEHRPVGGPAGSGAEYASTSGGSPSFTQVNDETAPLLRDAVLTEAGGAARVVDAYSGRGVYGRPLAAAGARVVGIESDPRAASEAERDAPEGFALLRGSVEDLLEAALPADVVIVNPPRAGLHERVPEVLQRLRPPTLLYVSCDPATLARDVRRLRPAYELVRTRCFDLFPQTAHVETLAVLRASGGTP